MRQARNLICATAPLIAVSIALHASAECTSRVWNTTANSSNSMEFHSSVPAKMKARFDTKLTPTDSLIIYELPRPTNEPVPHDEGFAIARNGHLLVRRSLMTVPAWRDFAIRVNDDDPPAIGISAAQICTGKRHVIAVAFEACCTTTTPLLYFIAVSNGTTYHVSTLPLTRGGKLELSRTGRISLRLWNETSDGACDSCLQHFQVTEYRIAHDRPEFVRRFSSPQRFKAAEFDPDRIVLLSSER